MSEAMKTLDDLGKFMKLFDPVSTEKLTKLAEKELGETPELKEECLQHLKTMISENKVASITTDDFLLRFLRSRKFDVERSFQTIKNYAHNRVEYHDIFMELNLDRVKEMLRHKIIGYLPYRDSEERVILWFRSGVWNTDICSELELFAFFFFIVNYVCEKQSAQTSGMVVLFNTSVVNMFNDSVILRHVNRVRSIFFNCSTARYQRIHIINESPIAKFIIRLLLPFLPKKLTERLLFHGETREVLFEHINPSILPEEFGGSLGPLSGDNLLEVMGDYLEKLKDEQKYFL